MQIPEHVLSDTSISSTAKTVLAAMWVRAEGEPAWTAARNDELASTAGLSTRQLRRVARVLLARGAIRREARQLAGRRVDGWGLARTLPPLQQPRMSPATDKPGREAVAKREEPHKSPVDPIGADLAQIGKHARRGDSHVQICERLLKARAPCSEGVWHKVKVFRRIERMASELGLTGKGLRAGEVVERWKKTR